MKKLTTLQKVYGVRRASRLARRNLAWKAWRKSQRRQIQIEAILAKTGGRPRTFTTVLGRVTLELPSDLSLQRNYDEVMEFIERLRQVLLMRRRRVYIDFRSVRTVSPAAALVLAAELDRWRRITRRKLRIIDAHEWDPDVYRLLDEMGLYDLLSVSNKPLAQPVTEQRFIRFHSSSQVLGQLAVNLRDDLRAIFGDDSFARKRLLYEALVEAMSNSRRHAYPEDFPTNLVPHQGLWWMSGAFDPVNNSLTVMFYDQGVGMPATIPRRGRMAQLGGWLAETGLLDDDASRIKASIELGATQTEERHRGLGMQRNIRRYINGFERDKLRILSAKGEYIYHGDGHDELRNHSSSLGGTLIQWELFVGDDRNVHEFKDH